MNAPGIHGSKASDGTAARAVLRLLVLVLLAFTGCATPPGEYPMADDPVGARRIVWERMVWPVRLEDGRLDIRGPGKRGTCDYKWESEWITVAEGVREYAGVGAGQGPVLAYRAGGREWRLLMLYFADGSRQNELTFDEPVTLVRGGDFGAVVKIGNRFYDYSWKRLQEVRGVSDKPETRKK